jgi:hypothetical protein
VPYTDLGWIHYGRFCGSALLQSRSNIGITKMVCGVIIHSAFDFGPNCVFADIFVIVSNF